MFRVVFYLEQGDTSINKIFKTIFKILSINPFYRFEFIDPENCKWYKDYVHSVCGEYNTMVLYNELNSKAIVLSFADRLESFYQPTSLLNVVQLIGGLSMNQHFKETYREFLVNRKVFNLPIYEDEEYLIDKYPSNGKIEKAIFIGELYEGRKEIAEVLSTHPLFEIIDSKRDDKYTFREYIDKIREYKMVLSLNGFGEICFRDYEAMAVGVPVIRSKLFNSYYEPLTPYVHYVSATEAPVNGFLEYNSSYSSIAGQFISTIERTIKDDHYLAILAINGRRYFLANVWSQSMIHNFFKLVNLKLLE